MLIRSLASILIVASSFVLVHGQTPEPRKEGSDKAAKTTDGKQSEKLRDIPLPAGIDLQFLIKELAREMDINVLFDSETFRGPRKTSIELKNVTTAAALDYVLLQEGLIYEDVGPRTIMVASRFRGTSIPRIGAGITTLTEQLAKYFGVEAGILVNNVRPDSSGSKVGLKAGDVIVAIDGEPVRGALVLIRAFTDKKESEITLTIVRDRKEQTIRLASPSGIER